VLFIGIADDDYAGFDTAIVAPIRCCAGLRQQRMAGIRDAVDRVRPGAHRRGGRFEAGVVVVGDADEEHERRVGDERCGRIGLAIEVQRGLAQAVAALGQVGQRRTEAVVQQARRDRSAHA
jgi:hypothetical protein